MPPSRNDLLQAAKALCDEFAAKNDIELIVAHFSTTHDCVALEHGEKCLAPFLGRFASHIVLSHILTLIPLIFVRPFTGITGIKEYFALLQRHLTYEDMSFSEYFADPDAQKVGVKGRAKFTWNSTGDSWNETFTYVLDFDHDCKVTNYEVWADSGAAYLASRGELTQVSK
jgi:hypothetical protein